MSPTGHIRGALIAGPAAYALSRVLDRYEIAERLAERGASTAWREQALAALDAIDAEAAAWRQDIAQHATNGSANGTATVPAPDGLSPSTAMTCSQAADQLQVTERQVRKLAAAGRLPGRLHGCAWLLDPAGVAAYATTRKGHQ